MSMTIVHHVLGKSQTQGSARTLLLTLGIHANDCCGVAWVSDTTLRHEVNVGRQRIHELKNAVEDSGELVIVERPRLDQSLLRRLAGSAGRWAGVVSGCTGIHP